MMLRTLLLLASAHGIEHGSFGVARNATWSPIADSPFSFVDSACKDSGPGAAKTSLEHWAEKVGVTFAGVTLSRFHNPAYIDADSVPLQLPGLRASETLSPGQTVLEVPLKLLLSIENIKRSKNTGAVLIALQGSTLMDAYTQDNDQDAQMRLLELFLVLEDMAPNSEWRPYLDELPRSTSQFFQDWSPDVKRFLATGSETGPEDEKEVDLALSNVGLYDVRFGIQTLWKRHVEPLVERYPELLGEVTYDRYELAFMWRLSRAFDIRIGEQEHVVMAPLIDLANHRAPVDSVTAKVRVTDTDLAMVIGPGTSYEPCDQVFLSYGRKSNAQLINSYGDSTPCSCHHLMCAVNCCAYTVYGVHCGACDSHTMNYIACDAPPR